VEDLNDVATGLTFPNLFSFSQFLSLENLKR